MYKFKLGDRVISVSTNDEDKNTVGKIGTIVDMTYDEVPRYGIRFDENVNGHTCTGNCEYGHGWYLNECDIKFSITDAASMIQRGIQSDENVNGRDALIPDFPDLSKWHRLTPKDWKERYKEYEGKVGYFAESFNLYDVDKIILCLCRIEDAVEQAKEQLKGEHNG